MQLTALYNVSNVALNESPSEKEGKSCLVTLIITSC